MASEEERMVTEEEEDSPVEEVDGESPLLGRQSSIYSLTLDEFQQAVCEGGKNFGSMNMDEFLNSIWTAEENQVSNPNNGTLHPPPPPTQASTRHPTTVARQGSITIPPPLCRKTVEEVWSEIQGHHNAVDNPSPQHTSRGERRQATFGEMTLEDFLIRAGVVRGGEPSPQTHYGLYPPSTTHHHAPLIRPPSAFINPSGQGPLPYTVLPMAAAGVPGGEEAGKGVGVYTGAPGGICCGGKMVEGGGYMGGMVGSPSSPVSSDGMMCITQREQQQQYGLDVVDGMRARKHMFDRPVEKVVERRQRRMIKNRESAARSRARKQAYTVELEAELNQLREENSRLKHSLAEMEKRRREQQWEKMQMVKGEEDEAESKDGIGDNISRRKRMRHSSCPL